MFGKSAVYTNHHHTTAAVTATMIPKATRIRMTIFPQTGPGGILTLGSNAGKTT